MPFDGTETEIARVTEKKSVAKHKSVAAKMRDLFEHKSVAAKMRDLFDGGARWGQGAAYMNGKYCLLGAYFAVTTEYRKMELNYLRVNAGAMSAYRALEFACEEIYKSAIISVNDRLVQDYSEIASILDRMEQLERKSGY